MTATIGSTGNILSLVSPTAAPIDEPNRPAFVSRREEKALAEREREDRPTSEGKKKRRVAIIYDRSRVAFGQSRVKGRRDTRDSEAANGFEIARGLVNKSGFGRAAKTGLRGRTRSTGRRWSSSPLSPSLAVPPLPLPSSIDLGISVAKTVGRSTRRRITAASL